MDTRDTNKNNTKNTNNDNNDNTNNTNTRTQCVTRNQTITLTKTCTTTTTTILPTRMTGMAEEKQVAATREEAGTVNHPKHRVVPPLVFIGWVLPRLKILTAIPFSWTTTTTT